MLPINIYEVFSHMKLWNAIFLFSLFCIVLLSACTNSNEVNTNLSSDIPEPTTQIESTDSGTSAPLEMTMALPSTGISVQKLAEIKMVLTIFYPTQTTTLHNCFITIMQLYS